MKIMYHLTSEVLLFDAQTQLAPSHETTHGQVRAEVGDVPGDPDGSLILPQREKEPQSCP